MTIRASKFTPELLLGAPRRGSGIPNSDGSQILFTESAHSFKSHKTTTGLYFLNAKSQDRHLITDLEGVKDPVWLDDEGTIALLAPGEKGATELLVGNVTDWDKT